MMKPIAYAMLLAGLLASSAHAVKLSDMLKDAAKQQIDKKLGKEEAAPASTPENIPAPVATPAPAANQNAAASPSPAASPAVEAQPAAATQTINWKKPSREEEIALGREITGSILGAAPLVKDDALQQYVNQVGRWVASQSSRADLPWKFGVIDSADVNAFAAPGGYVLITKGLYAQLQNEAQLAGVLGHEIAHVVKKHQLKVMQKQQVMSMGSEWIKEKLGKKNKIADKAISTGAEISARGLDKDAEFEADRMGMILVARAGYDVYGLPEVLQTMGEIKPGDSSVALLFKTHPSPDERLAKLSEVSGNALDNLKAGQTLEKRLYKLN